MGPAAARRRPNRGSAPRVDAARPPIAQRRKRGVRRTALLHGALGRGLSNLACAPTPPFTLRRLPCAVARVWSQTFGGHEVEISVTVRRWYVSHSLSDNVGIPRHDHQRRNAHGEAQDLSVVFGIADHFDATAGADAAARAVRGEFIQFDELRVGRGPAQWPLRELPADLTREHRLRQALQSRRDPKRPLRTVGCCADSYRIVWTQIGGGEGPR